VPNSVGHVDALQRACGRRESLRVEFTSAEIATNLRRVSELIRGLATV
jgi:hypothetical protein